MGIRLNEAEQLEFLQRGHTAVLTTLRRDGWPVSLPIWYAVLDGKVYLTTPPGSAKVKRIRHDDRCSLLVESGEAWVELAAVEFKARAVILEEGDEADRAEAELQRKYADFRPKQTAMPDATKKHYSGQIMIRLDPEPDQRVLSWDNSRIRMKSA